MNLNPPPLSRTSFWSTPRPHVLSGKDLRSSDSGLLTLFFGSAEHASRHNWLNAGRTLIDKTYVQLLWEAQQIPYEGKTAHDLASLLDSFVRNDIRPYWHSLDDLSLPERHELAIHLVDATAQQLFADTQRILPATWLLFYLLPQLPIMPITGTPESSYRAYHYAMRERFAQQLPYLMTPYPGSDYGSSHQRLMINAAVNAGDWWQRLCFMNAQLPLSALE